MPSKDEPRWPVPVNAESSHSHEAAVLDRLRAMRRPGERFDYEFAGRSRLCCIEKNSMVANNLVFRRSR